VEILKRFGMMDCKSLTTPMTTNPKLLCDTSLEIVDATLYMQMIGSLMYLTNTRPNICFAVNTLSPYMVEPRHVHLIATKHVMRYLKGTIEYGIKYDADCEFRLHGCSDSDCAGSVTNRKRTLGCCFSLGSGMISWFSKKQTSVALSTTEAEYMATCLACTEAIWILKLLSRLFDIELDATSICCDNQSCIKLLVNPVFHDKSNHIGIKYHFIHDVVEKGAAKLHYVATNEQVADVLTKPRSKVKFEYFRDRLGLLPRKRE
jgi:hypothetical protein